tara:strand:- start:2186 stop:2455 length:270 start_codon:yes stop_codon:yes gene_type:complete
MKITLIIALLSLLLFFSNRKFRSKKIKLNFLNLTFQDWMKMSKKDRELNDIKERENSLARKKILLEKIRKEYNKVAKERIVNQRESSPK